MRVSATDPEGQCWRRSPTLTRGLARFSRPQARHTATPVRFTSDPATTRMHRSRSNVFHSAHESAYAAAQQRSLPLHTRKVTGSIPVGTTRNAEVSSCLVGWPPLAIAFIRQNPPRVDLPLDYLKVRRGTGTAPHSTCGHRRRPETVESGIGDGGGGVVVNDRRTAPARPPRQRLCRYRRLESIVDRHRKSTRFGTPSLARHLAFR